MPAPQRIAPRPGQESVWDYPRPPRVEATQQHIQVVFNGVVIANSSRSRRVLETSHPPVYYIPSEDVLYLEYFSPTARVTHCEFKGAARYFSVTVGDLTVADAAWSYSNPLSGYESIANHFAVYPGRMDACFVDGEQVQSQPGDFYGGWITANIVGPFKGGPGTWGW